MDTRPLRINSPNIQEDDNVGERRRLLSSRPALKPKSAERPRNAAFFATSVAPARTLRSASSYALSKSLSKLSKSMMDGPPSSGLHSAKAGAISAYCMAQEFKLQEIFKFVVSCEGDPACGVSQYRPKTLREVVHLSHREHTGEDCFIFPYGCVIFWNFSKDMEGKLLEKLCTFAERAFVAAEFDDFSYSYGAVTAGVKVISDEFVLDTDDVYAKLSLSHALAQSTTLSVFEANIASLIRRTKHLPEELADTGKISKSDTEISKLMGELFVEKNKVNLHSDVLDVPEFFWERGDLEIKYYKEVFTYLDVKQRVAVLNTRAEVVRELFEMLRDELKHQQANKLEIIVIWLIVADVLLEMIALLIEYVISSK